MFELLLSRGAHLPTYDGPPLPPPAKPRGFLARLFTKAPTVMVAPEQISYDAFHLIMSGAPAERRGDTTYLVRHRQGGDAWFKAELTPQGYIRLAASHGYHAFPRNFGDMLDMGLRLTALVRAQLYTIDGQEIVGADIGRMLAPDGAFVKQQIAAFQAARKQVDDGMAPLEYPRDGIDLVADFFVFQVRGGNPQPRLSIAQTEDGTPLVRVAHAGDVATVRSTWAAPFDVAAHATLDVVDELGGAVALNGKPLDGALRAQVRKRCSGLGLDFAEWVRGLG